MSLDELARGATESLRQQVSRDVDPVTMLRAVRRTRGRRRTARVAAPLAAAALVAGTFWAGTRPDHPAPVSRPQQTARANGVLVGSGNPALSHPGRLHLPAISAQSSPTWSPDGRDLAVLDGDGILVTDVSTGARRTLPCPGCAEIAWSPDGTRFATVDRAGDGITLVDAATGLMTHSWLRMVTNLHSLTWAPDGRRLAFVGDSRGVRTHTRQAAYVADLRGGGGRVVLSGPMSDGNGRFNPARMLAVSWRPVDDQLAVLVADRGSHGWSSSSLRVVAVNSDGSGMTKLTVDGTCGCGGWTPNLTWSPDGTTLALYAKHRGFRSTLDATGSPVHIRLVRGSGPLAWQPR